MTLRALLAAAAAAALTACGDNETQAPAGGGENKTQGAVEVADKFTFANYDEAQVKHVALDLDVDFASKTLSGSATLDIEWLKPDAKRLVLDTRDLAIERVEARRGGAWREAEYTLGEDEPVLGSKLEIALPQNAEKVRIFYRTSPQAEGLQWLSPEQTDGKVHPYLFSQNQPIHARTMAPLQDTPAVRVTYEATIRTPPELLAVMSAEQDEGPRDGEYSFEMPQPIPSYLIAIAVGDIEFKAINDHIGVYSEAPLLDAAAEEFSETPLMEDANAALYGPYRWSRYDMLVLPASFPFGGMENPRLTFLTPTLIAGDKSLTNTVAHELAHSWSGNLVTNATWRDAWLNEGFTSYVENRVMEALYGTERAMMEQALGLNDLNNAVEAAARPALTRLKLPEDIQHPDDAFSNVAYEKGAFFLRFLENRFGREAFDAFLKDYFDRFAFKAITTEDFLAHLDATLRAEQPEAVSDAEIETWVHGEGVPDLLPVPVSTAFEEVTQWQTRWLSGDAALSDLPTKAWSTHEWLHFINTLPASLTLDQFAALDEAFSLSEAQNAEIAFAWYMQAISAGYEPAMPHLEAFLMRVGRGKFIYRLYDALAANNREAFAERVYEAAKTGYHPIAQRRIEDILRA